MSTDVPAPSAASTATHTAFVGHKLLVAGDLRAVLTKLVGRAARDEGVLVFEDETGKQVDFDVRGTLDEVLARELPAPPEPNAGPGRPRLGVISREVSLLPRHWDWLQQQPSGASAALRRIVEQAMKSEPEKERMRRRRDALGKLMWGLCGDLPDFEEASRALYAGDVEALGEHVRKWPKDVRTLVIERATAMGAKTSKR